MGASRNPGITGRDDDSLLGLVADGVHAVEQLVNRVSTEVGTLETKYLAHQIGRAAPSPTNASPAVIPGPSKGTSSAVGGKTLSGKYWVAWANQNAKNSESVDDLAEPFRSNVKAFIAALEEAGTDVTPKATRRDAKRAYLFHWAWLIALSREKPSEAKPMTGVDIEWNHGNLPDSRTGAHEMVVGFELAVPPHSKVAGPEQQSYRRQCDRHGHHLVG